MRAEFVYVANAFSNSVSAYHIDPATGALKFVAGSPFTGVSEPASVAVDLFGRSIYVANEAFLRATVSAYHIGDNGALTSVTGSPFPAGIEPTSVAVDLFGRFVYVANQAAGSVGNVSAYRIEPATGALRPVAGSPFAAGIQPLSVAVDFFGRFVYVANNGSFPFSNSGVSAYRIGDNGALTPVHGSPFATGKEPASVAVDLLGRFVYVANSFSNNVSAYRIDDYGALTAVAGSPFAAGSQPEFRGGGPLGPVRLRGKLRRQQRLGLPHRRQRGAGTHRRVALRCGDRPPFRGGGPLGSVRLRGKLVQQQRLGLLHR